MECAPKMYLRLKNDMIDKESIQPTHIIRLSWLYLLTVVPFLANFSIQYYQQNTKPIIEISVNFTQTAEPPFFPTNRELKKTERSSPDNGNSTQDPYMPIILAAASQYKVDPTLIKAIIMAESSYNPKAVSKRGAKGLMQLMPRTAKALGVEDSFNPEQNIYGGVKYFSQLLNKFNGDHSLALAAYNAGSRKVKKYNGIPPFKATKRYIKNVFKYQKLFKQEIVENG